MRLPRPFPVASLASMGLTGIAILTVGFNYGLAYGSASQGALLYALTPAAVAIAAVFGLKETLPGRRIAGIVLSVAGTTLVVASGGTDRAAPRPLLGALCMVAGVVAWAHYTVIAKRLADADQVVVIACVSTLGTAMLLPFAAVELLRRPMPPCAGGMGGRIVPGSRRVRSCLRRVQPGLARAGCEPCGCLLHSRPDRRRSHCHIVSRRSGALGTGRRWRDRRRRDVAGSLKPASRHEKRTG